MHEVDAMIVNSLTQMQRDCGCNMSMHESSLYWNFEVYICMTPSQMFSGLSMYCSCKMYWIRLIMYQGSWFSVVNSVVKTTNLFLQCMNPKFSKYTQGLAVFWRQFTYHQIQTLHKQIGCFNYWAVTLVAAKVRRQWLWEVYIFLLQWRVTTLTTVKVLYQ